MFNAQIKGMAIFYVFCSKALTVKRRWAWCSFMSTFIIFSKSRTSLKFILPSLFLSAFLNQSPIHLGMQLRKLSHSKYSIKVRWACGLNNTVSIHHLIWFNLFLLWILLLTNEEENNQWKCFMKCTLLRYWWHISENPGWRILVKFLSLPHIFQVLNQLPHAPDPGLCLLSWLCHQVQVAPATAKDQCEASFGWELICNAEQHLRLMPLSYCLHVAHWNWPQRKIWDVKHGSSVKCSIYNVQCDICVQVISM